MKITKVDAIPLCAPLQEAQSTSHYRMVEMCHTLVEVHTDEGFVGYGECLARFSPGAHARLIEEQLQPKVVGCDPFDTMGLWDRMQRATSGTSGGVLMESIAGVDMALWDLKGKALGLPVHKLLGGMGRTEVDAYASSIMHSDIATMEKTANDLLGMGFRAVKLKIGMGLEEDVKRAKILRRILGDDVKIGVDATWFYKLPDAIRLAKRLEEIDIWFLEEPLVPEDHDGYARLAKATSLPIAGGESEFTRFGILDLISTRALSIVQPDPARAGGITESWRIAMLADNFGVWFAPHVGYSGAVCAAAALQLAAAAPNLIALETMFTPNPAREELVEESVGDFRSLKDGKLPVPDTPGLGVTPIADAIAKYRVS